MKTRERRSMNELINIKNDEAVTDSLIIAESFGKKHSDVLEKIERIISNSAEKSAQCFKKSYYKDALSILRRGKPTN